MFLLLLSSISEVITDRMMSAFCINSVFISGVFRNKIQLGNVKLITSQIGAAAYYGRLDSFGNVVWAI